MVDVSIPQIEWSLSDLPKIWREGQMQRARQNSPLLAPYGGDMGLAALAMRKQEDARDFGFRQQEATRAQGNTDRSFALQKQQAEEAARGFEYREIDDGMGGKKLVRIEKATGAVSAPPIAGVQDTPANPFQQGKMNEAQSKDALYTSRMLGAEKILRGIDAEVATSAMNKFSGVVSDKLGINIRPAEYQKFDQARRDFVNATLRRESGAVISEQEFANANQQYFPQPGDTADLIKQKRANRMEAIRGIGAGAGPGYRPDYKFDDKGEIVDNPKPAKTSDATGWNNSKTIAAARANKDATLQEARDAIAQKPEVRDAVIQRLRRIGVDPAGL